MGLLNILVVDDEREILDLMEDALSQYGYKVTCIENGADTVSILCNSRMDMLFIDIPMPNADGLAILEEIHTKWPDLPVVVITASIQRELIDEAVNLGSIACLVKPFNMRDVIGMIEVAHPYIA
ncbi:MAG: response regulator [Armatimonadota bacterium]